MSVNPDQAAKAKADRNAAYFALADQALDLGDVVVGPIDGVNIWAVPDVVEAEFAANGESLPPAHQVERIDGRRVKFYRDAA